MGNPEIIVEERDGHLLFFRANDEHREELLGFANQILTEGPSLGVYEGASVSVTALGLNTIQAQNFQELRVKLWLTVAQMDELISLLQVMSKALTPAPVASP